MPYKNKEDRVNNSKDYYSKNKEKIKAYIKGWCSENKNKTYAYSRKALEKRKLNGYDKKYYVENAEKIKKRSKDHGKHWRKNFPEKAKNQTLKKKYGITLEMYEKVLFQQKNRCACCGLEFDVTDTERKPQVDHCHETGEFRAILCRQCNIVEGFLEKKSSLIAMVIEYKEKFNILPNPVVKV